LQLPHALGLLCHSVLCLPTRVTRRADFLSRSIALILQLLGTPLGGREHVPQRCKLFLRPSLWQNALCRSSLLMRGLCGCQLVSDNAELVLEVSISCRHTPHFGLSFVEVLLQLEELPWPPRHPPGRLQLLLKPCYPGHCPPRNCQLSPRRVQLLLEPCQLPSLSRHPLRRC
jgi:hypothetical protein